MTSLVTPMWKAWGETERTLENAGERHAWPWIDTLLDHCQSYSQVRRWMLHAAHLLWRREKSKRSKVFYSPLRCKTCQYVFQVFSHWLWEEYNERCKCDIAIFFNDKINSRLHWLCNICLFITIYLVLLYLVWYVTICKQLAEKCITTTRWLLGINEKSSSVVINFFSRHHQCPSMHTPLGSGLSPLFTALTGMTWKMWFLTPSCRSWWNDRRIINASSCLVSLIV